MALPTETYMRIIDMLRGQTQQDEDRRNAAIRMQQMLRQPEAPPAAALAPSTNSADWTPEQKDAMFAKLSQDALTAQKLYAGAFDMLKALTGQDGRGGGQVSNMFGLLSGGGGGSGPNPAAMGTAMGTALGLPPPPPSVYPAGMSQKSLEAFQLARAKATDARLSAIDKANQSADIEYPVQRFLELNQQNPTGGWRSLPGIQDLLTKFSAPRQEMESITSRLVPQLGRQGLPGSASNLDVQMFRSAVVSPDKSVQANMSIGNGLIAQQQRNKQHAEFLHAYADAYGNDLRGADQAWQQYVDANPIFDPEAAAKGEPSLNQNRMTWQQFFSSRGQPAAAAPAGGERPPLSAFMR